MKREIKFRGKSIRGVWVYGDLLHYTNPLLTSPNNHEAIIVTDYKSESDNKFKIIAPDTVGQYTGLKDKNGREIYEGDIVDVAVSPINYVGKDPTPYHRICVCVYQKENASFIYERVGKNYKRKLSRNWKYKVMGSYDIQCVEIIGNIYDNSELMKGGEE